MKSDKDNKKYKLAVFLDLKKSSSTTLKNAAALSKMINGKIEVFHVKKPADIVDVENQLSAMRTINHEHIAIDKKMKSLIKSVSEDYGVKIGYSFSFGNVKNEIGRYIKENRPDIIVLGKKKYKPLGLIGDRISDFVLNVHDGVVIFATNKSTIVPDDGISLGMLNSSALSSNLEFAEALMNYTRKPLKLFKIIKNSAVANELSESVDEGTIEYIFEHNDSIINNLSNYLSKNNIDLLSIDRKQKESEKQSLMTPDIDSMVGKLNVTILVTGK